MTVMAGRSGKRSSSNTSKNSSGYWDTENAPQRQQLHAAGVTIYDRLFNNGHIGHNKFAVYFDPTGKPRALLTGSTNWTANGLCAQTNNALLIEDDRLAAAYNAYWEALRDDAITPPPAAAKQPGWLAGVAG